MAYRIHNPQPPYNERRTEGVSNSELWTELRYIRRKVDSLETKVLYLFGGFSTITAAIAIYEFLRNIPK